MAPRFPSFSTSSSSINFIALYSDVGDQGRDAGAFEGDAQLALVPGAGAGDAAWHDAAALRDEALQKRDILEIDVIDFFAAEAAHALAAIEVAASAHSFLLLLLLALLFRFSSICHDFSSLRFR